MTVAPHVSQFIKNRPTDVRLVAGGIIFNETLTKLLIIKGRDSNKWGVPKGGINNDESYIDASLREIYEETGIKIKLLADILPFVCINQAKLYIYVLPENLCNLKPKDTAEISDIKWISLEHIADLSNKTKLLFKISNNLRKYVARVSQYKRIYQSIMLNCRGRYVEYDMFNKKCELKVFPDEFIMNKYLANKITLYIESNFNTDYIIRRMMDEFPKLLNTADICLTATQAKNNYTIDESHYVDKTWRRTSNTTSYHSLSSSHRHLSIKAC